MVIGHLGIEAIVLDESYEECGKPPLSSIQEEAVCLTASLVTQTTHLEREGGKGGRKEKK